MSDPKTAWLVRTRSGDILGPFFEKELLEELRRQTFAADDEIAPSEGTWISAQNLAHRETEEFTSTRGQTITRTLPLPGPSPESGRTETIGPKIVDPSTPITFIKRKKKLSAPTTYHATGSTPRTARQLLIGLLAIFIAWSVWLVLKSPSSSESHLPPEISTINTPLMKSVQELIGVGQRQGALRKLDDHHQSSISQGEIAYLVPYAALLITENGSTKRAQKLLQQVVGSPKAGPILKSRAHLWLGYLRLSQDQEDMGEEHFLDALELNDKDAAARFNLGRAYLKQGKFEKALQYLQLAELEAPDLWLIHIYKGRALVELGRIDQARYSFQSAVRTSRDRWLTYIYFSLFLKGIKEHSAARKTIRTMLSRDPHYELFSPPPLGFFQETLKYGEYLKAFLKVMKGGSNTDLEFGKLYISYLDQRTGKEGDRILRLAKDRNLMINVVGLKVLLDRKASSKQITTVMKRLPPNLTDFGYYAYVLRGLAFQRLGNTKRAGIDFKKAVKLEPKSAFSRLAYARYLKEHDRSGEAKRQINSLLSFHPHYIPALVSSQDYQ